MHPASRILIYLVAALAIPGLSFFPLSFLLVLAISALIALGRSPLRLVWRTRWLLLVLVMGYAYSLPGTPLTPALGDYSPSLEGFRHGLRQAMSLLALLLWLDILVLAQSADRLLGGLYQLAKPLSRLGVDRGRLALRLGLTLKAIEGLERGRGNLARLRDQEKALGLPENVLVEIQPARPVDVILTLALLTLVLGTWLSA